MTSVAQLFIEAIRDGSTGTGSAKRLALVLSVACMGVAVVILALAACLGHDVGVSISGVSVSLAGLSGGSYVGGKRAENQRQKTSSKE